MRSDFILSNLLENYSNMKGKIITISKCNIKNKGNDDRKTNKGIQGWTTEFFVRIKNRAPNPCFYSRSIMTRL